MSPSSSPNGDAAGVMTESHPGPSGRAASGTTVAGGRPVRSPGAHRGADYRLRGLVIEPAASVPAVLSPADSLPKRRRRHVPFVAEVVILVAMAALAGWLLQAYVVQPYAVTSATMAPSIQAGDRILIAKAAPLAGPIRSGEVVVIHPPKSPSCSVIGGHEGDLLLRIVGVPGQTIWSVGNTIFVNGRPLRERGWYNPRYGEVDSMPIPSTTLGSGEYFVMGDNRSDACDSRLFGPIPKSSIVGKGIAIVLRNGHVFLRTL